MSLGWEGRVAEEATADQKLVRELQKRLTENGHGRHVADGIYGPATREAVKRLLREIGWTDPDGELTPKRAHSAGRRARARLGAR